MKTLQQFISYLKRKFRMPYLHKNVAQITTILDSVFRLDNFHTVVYYNSNNSYSNYHVISLRYEIHVNSGTFFVNIKHIKNSHQVKLESIGNNPMSLLQLGKTAPNFIESHFKFEEQKDNLLSVFITLP